MAVKDNKVELGQGASSADPRYGMGYAEGSSSLTKHAPLMRPRFP